MTTHDVLQNAMDAVCSFHSQQTPINYQKFTVRWIKAKWNLFSLRTPVSEQLLQTGLAEGVLAVQGAWSLPGRSLTVPTETYLARQFIIVTVVMRRLLLLMMMGAIQLTTHRWIHFVTVLSTIYSIQTVFHILSKCTVDNRYCLSTQSGDTAAYA